MGTSMDPCLIPREASIIPIKDLKGNGIFVGGQPSLNYAQNI